MGITKENIIAELVANDYRTATVFKKYNIDFCCNGNRTLNEACEKKRIDVAKVINDLGEVAQQQADDGTDYKSWPIDLLVDYIEKKHHRYVTNKIEEIKPFLSKVVKVHGEHHPELETINDLFLASSEDLLAHMQKEEVVLFPFIRKMVEAKEQGKKLENPHFGTVENPVSMMKVEHETEGDRFAKIASLSNNYTPPADACTTYRVTFSMLKEFEDDLHKHIHLENNIVFPKAMAMEREF
ncbi:MAG: iron-sulfur cluster repair di-iron protein [Cyclobacteriaceae bacterium]|nr:iron-sulfur cluster repair di-iron protein [Cyclobacteriaceae bacterium]